MKNKNGIEKLRKEIDSIDNDIVDLLAKRHKLVQEIGKQKKLFGLNFLDEMRRRQVITLITQKARTVGLPENLIKNVYDLIHDYSLKTQEEAK
jgi:chorismate mutase